MRTNDHLMLQVIDVGNKLDRELEKMAEIEEQSEQKVYVAFGYLVHCCSKCVVVG